MLRGLVLAPVMHAVQAGVSERLLALLNGGAVAEVKSAVIANAQSKVLIVEFHQPIAARVLEEAQKPVPCLTRLVQSQNMKSRRSFIDFPERFARRIRS